jgi:two-component system NtrC family sensor kinase
MMLSKWAGHAPNRDSSSSPPDAHRLLDALVAAGCMVLSIDQKGEIHYCSPSLADRLGEVPADREAFVHTVAETEPVRQQIRQLTESFGDDNPSVDIYISGCPFRVTGITVPGIPLLRMVTFQDTSLEKHEKQQLERLERLATVGQIAAGAVHEFNNNLTSILGWAQIAEQNTDPESPAAAAVGIIAENAKKARRIFSKLLNMSRSRSDDESYAPASITKVADDALGILFFEMKTRNIRLTRSYEDVGLCRIDEDRIGQVFINIIKNAMEAMNRNGELSVSAIRDSDTVRIAFRDTGPGMSPEVAAKAFDSFFSTKKKDEPALNGGTGLGLSISLDILRQHGGDIELTSEPGLGSCFTVVLPVLENISPTERPSFIPRPTIPPGAVVLVVDDEPDIGEMIRMSLELKGVSVLSVQSGEDAIHQLKKMPFDAAFVDYSMPGLSGHDLGREIIAVQPNLPVVFMSGLAVETDAVVGDFIKKPFDLDEIQAKLYEVLKRKKDSSYPS